VPRRLGRLKMGFRKQLPQPLKDTGRPFPLGTGIQDDTSARAHF
jgi:hypothetical protein